MIKSRVLFVDTVYMMWHVQNGVFLILPQCAIFPVVIFLVIVC